LVVSKTKEQKDGREYIRNILIVCILRLTFIIVMKGYMQGIVSNLGIEEAYRFYLRNSMDPVCDSNIKGILGEEWIQVVHNRT
jgi:hypothetical protein